MTVSNCSVNTWLATSLAAFVDLLAGLDRLLGGGQLRSFIVELHAQLSIRPSSAVTRS